MIQLLKDNEEEALFSKTLATIRRDAPIQFTLPEKTFWENADLKKIEKTFALFEFRSLFTRLKNFFADNPNSQEHALQNSHSVLEGQTLSVHSKDSSKHVLVNPDRLQEASIALWLINSEISNPQLDDMLMFSGLDSFDEAYEYIFKKLKENKLEKVYEEIEKPIIHVVKEMQDYGILIDKKIF